MSHKALGPESFATDSNLLRSTLSTFEEDDRKDIKGRVMRKPNKMSHLPQKYSEFDRGLVVDLPT